jgi:hypothetical protein
MEHDAAARVLRLQDEYHDEDEEGEHAEEDEGDGVADDDDGREEQQERRDEWLHTFGLECQRIESND